MEHSDNYIFLITPCGITVTHWEIYLLDSRKTEASKLK